MYTPAQARQRGSRSRETGCEALIQTHGQRHPQSAKRSTIYTPELQLSLNNIRSEPFRNKVVERLAIFVV